MVTHGRGAGRRADCRIAPDLTLAAPANLLASGERWADYPLDQTDQELLIFTVSDEALEKAAGGTSWAQTYPQTCVATICVREIVVGAD